METLQRTANAGSVSTGYDIENSCRFDNTNTSIPDSLHFTLGTPTDAKIFTLSWWAKLSVNESLESGTSNDMILVGAQESGGYGESICMTRNSAGDAAANFKLKWIEESVTNTNTTARQFRDQSAWYHFMFITDTTNGTAGDRQRFYVNGERVSFTGYNYSEDATPRSFNSGVHRIGSGGVSNSQNNRGYQGYMAEMHFVDGTAQAVGAFGETDSASGIWKPKKTSGITYGTNGWYLDFAASGDMGNDVSGNGNDFTLIGIDATNQTTDTPTNNFATLNPVDVPLTSPTYSEGNLRVDGSGEPHSATFHISSGKWYYEFNGAMGVWAYKDPYAPAGDPITMAFRQQGQSQGNYKNNNDGTGRNVTTAGQDMTMQEGGVLRLCIDYDNGGYWIGVWEGAPHASDGSYVGPDGHGWVNTGASAAQSNPATGNYPVIGIGSAGTSSPQDGQDGSASNLDLRDTVPGPVRIYQTQEATSQTAKLNYGNPTYTWTGSSYTDANGYGKFQYEPPTGFYALCSKNLAEFG